MDGRSATCPPAVRRPVHRTAARSRLRHMGAPDRMSGWAAEARRWFYQYRWIRKVHGYQDLHAENVAKLKNWARGLGITARQWIATLAEVRGRQLRFGAAPKDKIRPFPTPGDALKSLRGGSFEQFRLLAWQQWKLLCDPAHVGLSVLVSKAVLREGQNLPAAAREQYIDQDVVSRAIVPSLVAIMTLCTLLGTMTPVCVELRPKLVDGWRELDTGTMAGEIIFREWAREALDILAT